MSVVKVGRGNGHGMKRALVACSLAVALLLVRLYRWLVSPALTLLFGGQCRFTPSCSAFAETSLRRFGPAKGSWLAVRRVCRCHPFAQGGEDPVPPVDAQRSATGGPSGPPSSRQSRNEPPPVSEKAVASHG